MNTPPPLPGNPMPRLIWWVIWTAFMSGLPMFFIFLQSPTTGGNNSIGTLTFAIPMMVVPLMLSAASRWLIIPRLNSGFLAFKALIIGIAFAEGVCFFGIFLFPKYKTLAFALSMLGVAQFMPIFIGRFYEPPKR